MRTVVLLMVAVMLLAVVNAQEGQPVQGGTSNEGQPAEELQHVEANAQTQPTIQNNNHNEQHQVEAGGSQNNIVQNSANSDRLPHSIQQTEVIHTPTPQQTLQQNPDPSQPQSDQINPQPSPQGHHSPGLAMHSLSKDQQQKMLEQQALRTSFDKSGEDSFAKYANLTSEQMIQLERKMHQQAQQAYQNAMKQMAQRERKQKQELQKLMNEQTLTHTQKISQQQNEQFMDRQNKLFNPYLPDTKKISRQAFNDYMFELTEGEYADFSIFLPVKQTVALYTQTYSNNQGVYSRTSNITNTLPPEIQIYQQDRYLILNESFYFKKYIVFEGKQNISYTIKFNNPGDPRLFSLSVVHLLEQSHIKHAISVDDIAQHGVRAANFYEDLKRKVEHSHGLGLMEVSNTQRLNNGMNHYYLYTLGELVVVAAACVAQIKMIEKLLNHGSVV